MPPERTTLATAEVLVPLMDGTRLASWPKRARPPLDRMRHATLEEVLTEPYPFDAHFAAYSRPDLPPRIAKELLDHPALGQGIPMVVLALDVDCPESHAGGSRRPAPDSWFDAELTKVKQLLLAHPAGYCFRTRGGYRLVYALEPPLVVRDEATKAEWTLFYMRCCCYLARTFGIVADPRCADWPRLYRAPHATRNPAAGPEQRQCVGDPAMIGLWGYHPSNTPLDLDIDVAAMLGLEQGRAEWAAKLRTVLMPAAGLGRIVGRRGRKQYAKASGAGSPLPADDIAVALLPAVSAIRDGRHDLYLCLGGALCQAGVGEEQVLQITEQLAQAAGDPKVRDRGHDAQTTTARYRAGRDVRGFGSLVRNWPHVADVLLEALGDRLSSVVAELAARPVPNPTTLDSAEAQLGEALDAARSRSGPTVVRASLGVGKTAAAVQAAITATTKVAMVLTTNAHAVECHQAIGNARPDVERRAGTLASAKGGTGGECPHSGVVGCFHAAGVSVPLHICRHCAEHAGCPGRLHARANGGAAVLVTNHSLLTVALEHVGAHGLLLIDECPAEFEHQQIDQSHLEAAREALDRRLLHQPYARLIAPVLTVVEHAPDKGTLVESTDQAARELYEADPHFRHALGYAEGGSCPNGIGPGAGDPSSRVRQLVDRAIAMQGGSVEPPLSAQVVHRMLHGKLMIDPAKLAKAALVFKALARLLGSHAEQAVARWASAADRWRQPGTGTRVGRRFDCCFYNQALARALCRPGPTILLDATADSQSLARFASVEVSEVSIEVEDNAVVKRVVQVWSEGTRQRMLSAGQINWSVVGPALADALTRVIEFGARTSLLVSAKPVADELRKLLADNRPLPHARADAACQALVAKNDRLLVAHHGLVRGRNEFEGVGWSDIDALVTIGDPIPNLGRVRAEAALLGLTEAEADERIRRAVHVELAQAHGRLRAPRRARPALSLRVGQAVPLGWHAGNAQIEGKPSGRPQEMSAMNSDELAHLVDRAGGVSALARMTGVSRSTLHDLLDQHRPISTVVAGKLRAPWTTHLRNL
jgi:hypothetical protein